MAVAPGLRQRKKEQTRRTIYEAARRLFSERGFDRITVAEVAREANVSEVTVFNYFPSKEDLFYGGMHFFEEELLEAVRERRPQESALRAFRRKLLESVEGLRSRERFAAIRNATDAFAASPSLALREREIVERYTRQLGEVLGGDVEAMSVAAALMGAHRAVVDYVRGRVREGVRGDTLAEEARSQIRKAFGRLEKGL